MPILNWMGKEAVRNHHHTVPFHLLRDVPELSVGDPGSGNLIVEGDNLVALKALLPYYAGQMKCITIQRPPQSCALSRAAIVCLGTAPTIWSTTLPCLKINIVGMLRIWNWAEVCGFSSTLSLTIL